MTARRVSTETRPPIGVLIVTLLTAAVSPRAASIDRIASLEDAFVEVEHSTNQWTIGNAGVTYSVRVARDGTLALDGLAIGGSDDVLTVGSAPDALAIVAGRAAHLGASDSSFRVDEIEGARGSHFVSMSVRLSDDVHRLIAIRRYVVYPHAAAVEMWTEFETADGLTRGVEDLNAYALTVPQGAVDWVSGLQTPPEDGGAFTRRHRALADGERLDLGSPILSSETTVPYFSIGNGHRRFFSGLIWSGAWSASLQRHGGDVEVMVGLPPMSAWARPHQKVEGPHAFVGVVLDRPGADIAAVTRFVHASRAGREFPALTTFNTWFLHGTRIDEDVIRQEIDLASLMGIELLQVDAGWYGGRTDDQWDFTSGLGSWTVDEVRFPSGLAALREYAHEQGVKMGLWIEPERVDRRTVGEDGLAEERFLAQQDGDYHPGVPNDEAPDGQICLAYPAARAWVLNKLTSLIDEVRPDNLLWDFNHWINCTREGHGHPTNGGNFAHQRGLYEILSTVRQRYPGITIENCSGGGHRIDFAMARLTDSAWMDDRTAPASHVRYNLVGLSAAFPAPYLFSYVMPHPDEPIQGSQDIAMLVRSRMPGIVGLTADLGSLRERELNELAQQFELAKRLRPLQARAVTYTLTPQSRDYGVWGVVQQTIPSTGGSLIFAFSNGAHDPVRVFLRDIKPDVLYELRSSDRGRLGLLRGADLIAGGLEIKEAPESMAQILVLDPEGLGASAPRKTRR